MSNDELFSFIKKNPISVGCGVLSLFLAAGVYLRSAEIPEAEDILVQKTAMAERYALNIKNSVQLKEQAEVMANATKELDRRIIRASQLGTNTQYFYKLQSDTGVKLIEFRQTTVAIPPTKAKTTYSPIAFNVAVQGTLPQVMNFLRQLEGGTHYCRVLTASCSGSASARNLPLTLSLNVEMLGLP